MKYEWTEMAGSLRRPATRGLGMTIALSAIPLLLTGAVNGGLASVACAQVTPQRLLESAKEPQNWLMYSGDYAGRRYSTLDQINTKNAASLVPKRSEEHTSELQSRLHLVCRLLLEKKKKKKN